MQTFLALTAQQAGARQGFNLSFRLISPERERKSSLKQIYSDCEQVEMMSLGRQMFLLVVRNLNL